MPECFVEFPTKDLAGVFLIYLVEALKSKKMHSDYHLHGRTVTIEESSQDELMTFLFPNHVEESEDSPAGFILLTKVFIIREEIFTLLNFCRSIKSRSPNRSKILERPFENIISIISKIPWHQVKIV